MLISLCVFGFYLISGIFVINMLLPGRSRVWRYWVGASTGLLLFMWLPAIFAFLFRFTMAAQWMALLTAAVAVVVAGTFRRLANKRKKNRPRSDLTNRPIFGIGGTETDRGLVRVFWCLVPVLTALMLFLQITHTLNPVDGGLNVGQSTYGDLCLHLSIATSLRGAAFPPEYALLPGTRLAYPFLSDALTTSMMLWGAPLRWAYIVPGVVMSALVFTGILLLAYQLTRSARLAGISLILMVFCGGFGFLYMWDMLPSEPTRFMEIFTGFYRAPANYVDKNIRWSNLLVDMWLPQRTFLGGWAILLPGLSMAIDMPKRRRVSETLVLAVFAGALPLIHTHSFLALGLFSAGCVVAHLFRRDRNASLLTLSAIYLGVTLALALPQMIAFTFGQAAAEGFIKLHFNWVNGEGGGRLIDTYLYFWIKNVGPIMLLMLPALFNLTREQRPIAAGSFAIFAVSELILFQPNNYDNNKLFYVWYLLMLPVTLSFGASLWRRMKGVRGRAAVAAVFVAVSMLSGVLSAVREAVSDYQLFSPAAVKAGEYAEKETPVEAVFMTAANHNNPVSALAGRKVVCGPSMYLYFHGLPYKQNESDVYRFYADPTSSIDIIKKYDVSYIVYGDYERTLNPDAQAALEGMFKQVYSGGGYYIYQVNR